MAELAETTELSGQSLRTILSNMNADVIIADIQTVNASWRRDNFVHTFNRMYYILEGEGRIEVGGDVYYPKPGQLVVMPCNVRQSYSTISDQVYRKYWCHFTARVGSRDLFDMFRFPVCIDVGEPAEVERWFRQLIKRNNSESPTSILTIRASMLQLIGYFVENSLKRVQLPSAPADRMSRVLRYIEEHLDEKITVEHLAGLVHYHPNYFIRAFHSVFGCSPIQYINRMRLDKARQLLHSDMPIGAISRAVGIDPHNFAAMFKSCTGFSPRAYRKLLTRK
ncbi:MAG: AraC family transcriptional regulator [Paenibacillus sp.]|jgi:AraC-like DNA-binding protein|nr:AraC family transcriptional regulator [Paenibacillus sp.]